jgi:uncharacterized pyridoxamine 5'-phosphate oxidase family protein
MKKLNNDVIHFFHSQGCVIVSTVNQAGAVHNACKGIVEIIPDGKVFLLDLYHGKTYAHLRANPNISITAIDEHKFKGYCLQGKARVASVTEVEPRLINAWEEKMTGRITQRMLKNISGEKGHLRHPEARLPEPKYLIAIDIENVIDLTPLHLKQEAVSHG